MSYVAETQAAGREIFPDLARAWALFGIAVVNVGVFSYPMMAGGYHYNEIGLATGLDKAAFFIVNGFFLMKAYSLFSFMFGVGFAYQMKSADRAETGFAGRYWRRILGLFFFAAINITFLFMGDILFVYAVLGSVLFLFRKAQPGTLITWAIIFFLIQMVFVGLGAAAVHLGVAFAPEEMLQAEAEMLAKAEPAIAIYSDGNFWQTVQTRVMEWLENILLILLTQGWGVMTFFLLGLAAVRKGMIADPTAKFWRTARWVYLPIGVVISCVGGWLMLKGTSMVDPNMMWGMFFVMLGSPLSTAGYLGLIAKFSQGNVGAIKAFFARGGTASLTAYLLQGLILTFVFYEFGFGLYTEIGAFWCILIAAGVAVFTIAFASLWRVAFKRGPMEAILRRFTYMGG